MLKKSFQKNLILKNTEHLTYRTDEVIMLKIEQALHDEEKLFTKSIVEELWDRTGGKCMICGKTLIWKNRGKRGAKGAWKAGPICNPSFKGYVLSNCEIDCLKCYEQTRR